MSAVSCRLIFRCTAPSTATRSARQLLAGQHRAQLHDLPQHPRTVAPHLHLAARLVAPVHRDFRDAISTALRPEQQLHVEREALGPERLEELVSHRTAKALEAALRIRDAAHTEPRAEPVEDATGPDAVRARLDRDAGVRERARADGDIGAGRMR